MFILLRMLVVLKLDILIQEIPIYLMLKELFLESINIIQDHVPNFHYIIIMKEKENNNVIPMDRLYGYHIYKIQHFYQLNH
jgi:hypothetical protein